MRYRDATRDEATLARLLKLSRLYAMRRGHIEACMACTEGMGIAGSHSSADACMDCPTLGRLAKDLESERAYRARRIRGQAAGAVR